MNNDQLLFQTATGIEEANRLAQLAWNAQAITHDSAVKLSRALSLALASAVELERRAAGVPPPRIGD